MDEATKRIWHVFESYSPAQWQELRQQRDAADSVKGMLSPAGACSLMEIINVLDAILIEAEEKGLMTKKPCNHEPDWCTTTLDAEGYAKDEPIYLVNCRHCGEVAEIDLRTAERNWHGESEGE